MDTAQTQHGHHRQNGWWMLCLTIAGWPGVLYVTGLSRFILSQDLSCVCGRAVSCPTVVSMSCPTVVSMPCSCCVVSHHRVRTVSCPTGVSVPCCVPPPYPCHVSDASPNHNTYKRHHILPRSSFSEGGHLEEDSERRLSSARDDGWPTCWTVGYTSAKESSVPSKPVGGQLPWTNCNLKAASHCKFSSLAGKWPRITSSCA